MRLPEAATREIKEAVAAVTDDIVPLPGALCRNTSVR